MVLFGRDAPGSNAKTQRRRDAKDEEADWRRCSLIRFPAAAEAGSSISCAEDFLCVFAPLRLGVKNESSQLAVLPTPTIGRQTVSPWCYLAGTLRDPTQTQRRRDAKD